MQAPEFSRPFAVERAAAAQDQAARIQIEATAQECAALAQRMRIEAVGSLSCRFALHRIRLRGGEIAAVQATGTLQASVTQICVVTLEPFEASLSEDFAIRFIPQGSESPDIDVDDQDEIPYADGSIDLGEAAAEQLALALDPYPRRPGAAFAEADDDAPRGAFASLSRLARPQ